jgi:hypothetical protein
MKRDTKEEKKWKKKLFKNVLKAWKKKQKESKGENR